MLGLEDNLIEFPNVTFKGLINTEEELVKLFYFKFQEDSAGWQNGCGVGVFCR